MATKANKREARKAMAAQVKASGGPEFWLYGLGLLVALFMAFQVYGPALGGPFLFDDFYLPMNMPDWGSGDLSHWMGRVRPLLMFTYWANYQLGGSNPVGYHEWNVVFHLLNAGLVWLIVRKLLQMAKAPSEILALFAGGLFLLHPVQTEAVAYIAGRSDALSSIFFFGAFALFLYRRSVAISWPAAIGVLALFGAAAATKENTVVLPVLMLLTDYFWNPGFSFEGIRGNWKLYLPMAAGAVIGGVKVAAVLRNAESAGFQMKDLKWYEYLFTQFRVFFVYLRLFFVPSGQTVDYDFPISHSIFQYGSILGLIGILALLAAAVYFHRRFPLASYGFLAFILLLAPTSSVIPIRDPIAERRLYLPMLGLLLIVIEALRRLRISRMALGSALAAVLLISAALTYRRSIVWSGAIPLWEDATLKSPGKARAHFWLGRSLFDANRCQDAETQYEEVARLEPPEPRLLIDWALADNCLNRPEAAISKLERAAAIEKTAHVYTQIGMMYAKTNRPAQALAALDTAEKLDPNFDLTYIYRGQIFESMGNFPAAAAQFERALAINPRNEQAIEGMGRLRAKLGR